MLRVTAFTGGAAVPSARFRVRQYIPALRGFGIEVRETPARFGSYPPACALLRPLWGIASVAERFSAVLGGIGGDVTWLQREMLSTLATVERFTRPPRVLDVDDAIWLLRGGRAAVGIARLCDHVICGNDFIADFFREHTKRVTVLPTAVDTERFCPAPGSTRAKVICWSGTSSGLHYLEAIEKPIAAVLKADAGRKLRVVCDAAPKLTSIPSTQLEFVEWSEAVEVAAIRNAAAAIMPLDDSAWSRGKCGYKLLSCLACGVPVVASPVGVNAKILAHGDVGITAATPEQWKDALEFLLSERDRAAAMGAKGRQMVVREYSVKTLAPRLAEVLKRAA
jgi:glycosyltransferase involved in cell wall biosynthesis